MHDKSTQLSRTSSPSEEKRKDRVLKQGSEEIETDSSKELEESKKYATLEHGNKKTFESKHNSDSREQQEISTQPTLE